MGIDIVDRTTLNEYAGGVKRYEDMSPTGMLRLFRQRDGDVILEIVTSMRYGMETGEPRSLSVEFCTGAGGGQSQNTLMALIALIEAMKKDELERPQHRGE